MERQQRDIAWNGVFPLAPYLWFSTVLFQPIPPSSCKSMFNHKHRYDRQSDIPTKLAVDFSGSSLNLSLSIMTALQVLVFAAHLPLLLEFYSRRMSDPVWYLTPLAWVAIPIFLMILQSHRRLPTLFDAAILVANAGLLTFAYFLHSPWLGAVAAMLPIAIVCRQFTDISNSIRLGRLALLFLLTAGPPPVICAILWRWWTEAAQFYVSVISTELNIIHSITPHSFITDTGRFMLTDVFGNPVGPFLIYLTALSYYIWQRRSVIHLLACIPFVAVFAFLHAVLTGVLVLLTHSDYAYWSALFPCSAAAFLATIPLILSLDSLASWFTEYVVGKDMICNDNTDSRGRDAANAVRTLWNRWVSAFPPANLQPLLFHEENGMRVPLHQQITMLWKDWRDSRDFSLLKSGVPTIAAVLSVVAFLYYQSAARDRIVSINRQWLAKAVAEKNPLHTAICHQMIQSLAPNDVNNVLDYADFLIQQERPDRAVELIYPLCTDGRFGIAKAHFWMVRNSDAGKLPETLSDTTRLEHLIAASKEDPENVEIRHLLVSALADIGEIPLALLSYQQLTRLAPEYLDERFQFEARCGRLKTNGQDFVAYISDLQSQHAATPGNAEVALRLFNALTLSGKWLEAVDVLRSTMATQPAQEIRTKLSSAVMLTITKMMTSQVYDRAVVKRLASETITIDARNSDLSRLILELTADGYKFSHEEFQLLLDNCQRSQDGAEPARRMLAHCLRVAQSLADGTEMKPVSSLPPDSLSPLYLKLLRQSRNGNEAAVRLGNTLLEELQRGLDPTHHMFQLQISVLLETSQFDRAITLLRKQADQLTAEAAMQGRRLLRNIILRRFDSFAESPNHALSRVDWLPQIQDKQTTLMLLEDFAEIQDDQATFLPVAERLARLVIAKVPGDVEAEDMLLKMHSADQNPGSLAKAVGTVALNCGKYEFAKKWLSRAAEAGGLRNDYQLLNNLAVLYIRKPESSFADLQHALNLITDAVEIVPNHPSILATRGEIYLRLGTTRLAMMDLEKAIEFDSENSETLELFASSLDQNGQHKKALEIRQQIGQTTDGM